MHRMLPDVRRRTKRKGILDRLSTDPAAGRKWFLVWTGTATAGVTLAAAVLAALALTSSGDMADRAALAGAVVGGATLLLAAIAAVVALLAYAVSTGSPDLEISIRFEETTPNNPKFAAEAQDDGSLQTEKFKHIRAAVLLRNNSSYSARNPAVIVRLKCILFARRFDPDTDPAAYMGRDPLGTWSAVGFSEFHGVTDVQWDGGPNFFIHGNSTRRLPDLLPVHLSAFLDWGTPEIGIELLAEGFHKEVTIPVDFVVNDVSQFPQEKVNPEWM